MHVRSLGFRTDLALLTSTGSTVEDRGTHLVVRTPSNPGYHWGNFLLLAQAPVPGGEREVVGAFHTEFPDAAHVAIGIDCAEDGSSPLEDGARERFAAGGAPVSEDVVLAATALVQPLTPLATVTVRPLSSDEDWAQRAELGATIDDVSDAAAHAAYQQARNDHERAMAAAGDGERFGAFVEDRLVATAAVYRTEPTLARFQNVETHADLRRQGIGATVVHAAGRHALDTLGVERLVMVAEADGPAIGMYRRLGFEDVERQVAAYRAPGAR